MTGMTVLGFIGWLLAAFTSGLLVGSVTMAKLYQPLVDDAMSLAHEQADLIRYYEEKDLMEITQTAKTLPVNKA